MLHRVGDALGRIVEIVRDEGPFSLWCKVMAVLGYRRVLLIERPIGHVAPPIPTGVRVTVETLAEPQVDEYCAFRPAADPQEIRGRLGAGHQCFVARVEGSIVHTCWVFTGTAHIGSLGRDLRLAPDEIYVDESYTLRGYRGLGIAAERSAAMLRHYRQRGYRRTLAVVFPESHPARRALEKIGCRPIATMGYLKLGPWRRDFYRPHPDGAASRDGAPDATGAARSRPPVA